MSFHVYILASSIKDWGLFILIIQNKQLQAHFVPQIVTKNLEVILWLLSYGKKVWKFFLGEIRAQALMKLIRCRRKMSSFFFMFFRNLF